MRRSLVRNPLSIVVLSFIFCVVSLELGLQLASIIFAPAAQHEPLTRTSSLRILCCGDSFTYGLGASKPERSYPAQLELQLRTRLPNTDLAVVNAGRPGTNSSETVQTVTAMLEQNPYHIVLALTGLNNYWNLSLNSGLTIADNDAKPQHRQVWANKLRTLRLARLLGARIDAAWRHPESDLGICWQLLQTQRDPEAARTCFKRHTESNPSNPWAKSGLGVAAYHLKDYQACSEVLSEVVGTTSQIPDVYLYLGLACMRLGEQDLATTSFTELTRFSDANSTGKAMLGWLALRQGRLLEAKHQFATALAHDSFDMLSTIGTGYCLLIERKFAEARNRFAVAPEWAAWPTATLGLALCSIGEHDLDAAQRYLDNLASRDYEPERIAALEQNLADQQAAPVNTTEPNVFSYAVEQANAGAEELTITLLSDEDWFFMPFPDIPPGANWLNGGYQAAALRTLTRDLTDLVNLTRQRRCDLWLLTYPSSVGRKQLQESIRQFAAANHLPVVDLESLFANLIDRDGIRVWFPNDRHPTDEGYSLIAQTLAERLSETVAR